MRYCTCTVIFKFSRTDGFARAGGSSDRGDCHVEAPQPFAGPPLTDPEEIKVRFPAVAANPEDGIPRAGQKNTFGAVDQCQGFRSGITEQVVRLGEDGRLRANC